MMEKVTSESVLKTLVAKLFVYGCDE